MLVELIDGTLPWRTESGDRSAALSLKQECLLDPEQLTSNVPMPGTPLKQMIMPLLCIVVQTCFYCTAK